jgi:membrane protease YdiL (CAAX protease family)
VTVSYPAPLPESVVNAPAPYVPPTAARWGIVDAGIGLLVLVVVLFGGASITAVIPDLDPNSGQFWFGIIAYGLIVVYLVIVSFTRGQRSLVKDFGLSFRWIDLPLGFGIAVVARILSAIFVLVATGFTGTLPEGGNVQLGDDKLWAVLYGVLIGSLLAPLVEELFFRGLVLRAVRNAVLRGPGRLRQQPAASDVQKWAAGIAALASAGLFAALHYNGAFDPTLIIALTLSTFAFGLINAFVTLRTGRMGAAIIAHVFFNGAAISLLLLFGDDLAKLT